MTEAEPSGYLQEEVESATSSSSCRSTFAEGASNVSTAVSAPGEPTAAALNAAMVAGGKEFAEPPFSSSESLSSEAAAGTVAAAKLGCTGGHSIAEEPSIQGFPSAHRLKRDDPSVKAVMVGEVVKDTCWRLTGQWRLNWWHEVSSEFQWQSCDPSTGSERPCSGCYDGHFDLQRNYVKQRYVEKTLELTFTENAEGGLNIDGRGSNNFGNYDVRGVVFADHRFELVKLGPPALGVVSQSATSVWNPRLQQMFTQLLQYTSSAPQAIHFRKPVTESVAPHYKDIIKTPMDLQTLRENFKKHKYNSPDDFISDARLIFTNAWTFNSPGDIYYNAADVIYLRFEGRLSEITGEPLPEEAAAVQARVEQHRDAQGLKKRKRVSKTESEPLSMAGFDDSEAHDMDEEAIMTPRSGGGHRRQATPRTAPSQRGRRRKTTAVAYDEALHESMQELTPSGGQRRSVGRAGGLTPSRGRGGKGKSGHAAAADGLERRQWEPQPLSEEEKVELQERIDCLNEDDLDSVLEFLTHDVENSGEGKVFSLDVDALTPARQRALVDFVELKLSISNKGS